MAKTNKEIRSDFAKEMRDKYNERNEQLEQVEKLPLAEDVKESARKNIEENFKSQMDEVKSRPGYSEAEETHLEEIKAKSGVRKAKTAKEKLLKEYEEKLAKADAEISDAENSYNEAQVAHRGKIEDETQVVHRGKVEDEEKSNDGKESLRGNTDAILHDLKENHVKIKPNVKYMGYKGEIVRIDLPKVGSFPGFKFEYFVSYDYVQDERFKRKPELKEKLYSMSDISKLLQAMNKYMIELDGENDGDMDYENELTKECKAGVCLQDVTGLNSGYWMKDRELNEEGVLARFIWYCGEYNRCFYQNCIYPSRTNLFLKLSD